MLWLKSNWLWTALNLIAASIMIMVLSRDSGGWDSVPTFDPGLESGKWSIRFLLLCLLMTPLRSYFGWNGAIKLRKPAGLWSFGFAVVHILFFINEDQQSRLTWPMPLFIALGFAGMVILTALAVTSNRWAMRRLRKSWKWLHRSVYVAGLAVVFHALLAATTSKKVLIYDPQAIHELRVYLALLMVLLVVRIPLVRRILKQISLLLPHRREVDSPMPLVTLPDRIPEYPKLNGHETNTPSDKPLPEVQPEEEVERLRVW